VNPTSLTAAALESKPVFSHRHAAVIELVRMAFVQLATLPPHEAADVTTRIEAHIVSMRIAADIG